MAVPVRLGRNVEAYPAGEPLPAVDPWVEWLAYLMDGVIPIGRWSFGLDPLLGLIPGIGDLLGALISMVIVVRAVQSGIPSIAVARMTTNIAIDTLVGSIPIVGDAFDFGYKSNLKNLRIYQECLQDGRAATARHWWFFTALLALLVAGLVALVFGIIALIRMAF